MERVAIHYADQNEAFAPFLPRAGAVVGVLGDTLGNRGWLLVDLDEPFEYQVKVGDPYRYRGTTITHFLVRSRTQGQVAGSDTAVSVFVLLVEQTQLPVKGPIDLSGYIHAAWGTCRPIADGA